MEDFRLALESCRLVDMGFRGYPFTWNNKRLGDANTKERLDQAVANSEWRERFPANTLTNLFSHASDHAPLVLQTMTDHRLRCKGAKGFKFEESWLLWDDCERMMVDSWTVGHAEIGSALSSIKAKIENCGVDLHAWGSSKTKPDVDEIKRLQAVLQSMNKKEPSEETRAEYLEASRSLDALLLKQEIFWHQRSWVSWLKYGDKNKKYFHSKASQRRRRNFIMGIKDKQNNWVEEMDDIAEVATNYFETIFTSGSSNRMEECIDSVPHKVTEEMREFLSSEYSEDEIKATLFQIRPTKAPGPDGMNALFYQKFWHIVGNNVIAAVLNFLNSGFMPPEINYIHIVLIPKIKNQEKITDYRPISLCNVIYKIISKVLANRLKMILPQLISPSQSAFVPGHLVSDNVLVAYETLHALNNKRSCKNGSLALKLDVSKAYDRVE